MLVALGLAACSGSDTAAFEVSSSRGTPEPIAERITTCPWYYRDSGTRVVWTDSRTETQIWVDTCGPSTTTTIILTTTTTTRPQTITTHPQLAGEPSALVFEIEGNQSVTHGGLRFTVLDVEKFPQIVSIAGYEHKAQSSWLVVTLRVENVGDGVPTYKSQDQTVVAGGTAYRAESNMRGVDDSQWVRNEIISIPLFFDVPEAFPENQALLLLNLVENDSDESPAVISVRASRLASEMPFTVVTETNPTTAAITTTATTVTTTLLPTTTVAPPVATTISEYFTSTELVFFNTATQLLGVIDERGDLTNELAYADPDLGGMAREAINVWWDYCLLAYVEASNLVPSPYTEGWSTPKAMAAGWEKVVADYELVWDEASFLLASAAAVFLCPEGDPDDWDGYHTRNRD